ncbi:MAG: hypothetical protein HY369_02435 [Candidatus Aenigmarchaeota archaeon]|nr:hypothetical protein [Candidatus Aenigmarchaeota archaeon]
MGKNVMLLIPLLGVVLTSGCISQNTGTVTISGTQDLVLNDQDLQQLGMMSVGTDCRTEEYPTNEYSPLAQYSFCNYTISSLNQTEVVLELKKYTNLEDLHGTYQYDSSHLFGAKGLISENAYGDMSRFRVNSEDDYGAEFTDPNVYYYHLWIVKSEYLIHLTSKGTEEAGEYMVSMGQLILSKFG